MGTILMRKYCMPSRRRMMLAVVGCIWLRDDEAKCSLADEEKCSLAVSDMVVVVVVAEDVTIADDGLSGL